MDNLFLHLYGAMVEFDSCYFLCIIAQRLPTIVSLCISWKCSSLILLAGCLLYRYTIKRGCKEQEENCLPTLEESRFTEESFTKEGCPERDPSPVAVSP